MPGKISAKNNFSIKENSWLAWLAAKKLRTNSVAIVFGKTIHLYHATKEDFLKDERWLKHELCHIEQYRRYGLIGFITRYTWESIRHGYYNNRFEAAARAAENS